MDERWLYRTPAAFPGKRLFRLGLAVNYGIDEDGVRFAVDRGVNLFLLTRKDKARWMGDFGRAVHG